jgi:23S rRNA (cytidine1920-2'-O)/16S rRNA (cytidine1409-2'-O)-methyltransferase
MGKLIRADILLAKKGLVKSREKAKQTIESGLVLISGKPILKPSSLVDEDLSVKLVKQKDYVSRGGKKLEWALKVFGLDPKGKIAIDVGASTGGFTHCLLAFGAKKVVAVDVGYGQLDWQLRNDPRVEVFERTNIKYLKTDRIGYKADFAGVDVSFISVLKIIQPLLSLMNENFEIVTLIKPQFEAGKDKVGKGGVIRSPEIHLDVLENIYKNLNGLEIDVCGVTYSPIKGAEGNIEYLFYLCPKGRCKTRVEIKEVREVVDTAHKMAV